MFFLQILWFFRLKFWLKQTEKNLSSFVKCHVRLLASNLHFGIFYKTFLGNNFSFKTEEIRSNWWVGYCYFMGGGHTGLIRVHSPAPLTHNKKHRLGHRYLRKVDCSSFVMCPLLQLALPRIFLQQPLTVLIRQTSQVVRAINQSILNMMSMDCTHRYIREVDILVHEKPTSTKQDPLYKQGSRLTWQVCWVNRCACFNCQCYCSGY